MRVFQPLEFPLLQRCPSGAASKKEKSMKLITRYELANRPTSELRGLLRQTFDALAQSAPESPERLNALASIENIQAELDLRRWPIGLAG
jgi:hypothetical protein